MIIPRFKSFASLWTLTDHPVPLAEKLGLIRDAGFDGVGGHALPEIAEGAKAHDLAFIAYVVLDGNNFKEVLSEAATLGPARINAFYGAHDTLPAEAAMAWVEVMAWADKLGVELDLETHRATCTETPEKIATISATYLHLTEKALRYSLDFSHPAVVKHLFPHEFFDRLVPGPGGLHGVRQIHFRPFNGHHCQIPATDGLGNVTPSFREWQAFADAVLKRWLDEAPNDAVLWGCPELGPVSSGYALEGFHDVWEDAKLITATLKKTFARLLGER